MFSPNDVTDRFLLFRITFILKKNLNALNYFTIYSSCLSFTIHIASTNSYELPVTGMPIFKGYRFCFKHYRVSIKMSSIAELSFCKMLFCIRFLNFIIFKQKRPFHTVTLNIVLRSGVFQRHLSV